MMCRPLDVSRSGFYQWLGNPRSNRAVEDQRLLGLIRAAYTASHGIYGAPRIFLDLREAGETCSKHRVARIMRANNLKARYGYRAPRYTRSPTSLLTPNTLQRGLTVPRPNTAWVTDMTYVRTWEGWLYLAVVMDLYAPPHCRLVHQTHAGASSRAGRIPHGCAPTQAPACPDSLRSRVSIRQRCGAALLPGQSSRTQHESTG